MSIRTAVAALLLCPAVLAQSDLFGVFGAAGIRYGHAISSVGDVNFDGYDDFLVGAPGMNGGKGGVFCLSGKRLATGAGPISVWSLTPTTLAADANFGWSLAVIGDISGDGVSDFTVGAPYDDSAAINAGAVYLVDGVTHAIVAHAYGSFAGDRLGWSMDSAGDMNLDGKSDLIVGAPGYDFGTSVDVGAVYKLSGAALQASAVGWSLGSVHGIFPGEQLGFSVVGGVNLDGDLDRDVVAGAPYADLIGYPNVGAVRVYDGTTLGIKYSYYGHTGDYLGWTLDSLADYNGDNRPDVIIGAPYSDAAGTDSGRVVVASGYDLYTQTGAIEIYDWAGTQAGAYFGSAVLSSYDLNADGKSDLAVGAPGYAPILFGNDNGAVYLYSGETGERMGTLLGQPDEFLGDALARTLADFNNDGARDFVVGGSSCDSLSVDGGVAYSVSLFPSYPSSYCTGKVNSLGCTPGMFYTGSASASAATPFTVRATNVLNQKSGLLFYGYGPNSSPFQGGVLCVKPPTLRSAVQNSGGSTSGSDCTGVLTLDFNQRIQGGVDPALVLGQEVFCQYWSRDPGSASTTSLSNALRFLINP